MAEKDGENKNKIKITRKKWGKNPQPHQSTTKKINKKQKQNNTQNKNKQPKKERVGVRKWGGGEETHTIWGETKVWHMKNLSSTMVNASKFQNLK